MRSDFDERATQMYIATNLFNENSAKLYPEPGILSIDITDIGYKFKVKIKRARSEGVRHMGVFCYDLMLAQLRSMQKDMHEFLIHDSTIFSGVDERQIAKAIELAADESKKREFQYVCAINSDRVPYTEFSTDFIPEFKQSIRLELTDDPTGGLFGIRF